MDLLRTRNRERLFLEACLKSQMRFVVDNTNPTKNDRAKYISMAQQARYEVIGYYFESTSSDAVKRNSQRSGRFLVPLKGIYGTNKRLEPPVLSEGFSKLYIVRLLPSGEYDVRLADGNEDK
ncbi:AAA family ATPase [Pontibacter korlensis]|nr:AAA family ATPase [Pontibacter korlensis]